MIGFVQFFIAMFVSLYFYDRRLKTEYLNYHDQWIKDGSPLGMFSIPSGTRLFSGGFSRVALCFQWLFTNPQWAINDNPVRQYLFKMRMSWTIGALVWLIMANSLLNK
jgi:hypothetical protein